MIITLGHLSLIIYIIAIIFANILYQHQHGYIFAKSDDTDGNTFRFMLRFFNIFTMFIIMVLLVILFATYFNQPILTI